MPKRLPRPDELIVERNKVVGYLLNPDHPDGASKARFFTGCGFNVDQWDKLADALKRHGRERDVAKEDGSAFGTKYVLRCKLMTPDQRNPCICSVWIMEEPDAPRLVTAYPENREVRT